MRKVLGLLLFIVGLVIVLADVHVAYLARGAAHTINIVVGLLIAFAGGYVMLPTVADAFADTILKRIPALQTLWPGGMRRTDPPPDPNVPPPPSVTGESEER
jgi:membrane-bound ClpP family serine protease